MEKFKIGKKARAILVIAFIAIYMSVTYISLRGQYLEYIELGEQYVEKFLTDIKYKYSIMAISFVLHIAIFIFSYPSFIKTIYLFFIQNLYFQYRQILHYILPIHLSLLLTRKR